MDLERIFYNDKKDVWETRDGKVVEPIAKGDVYLTFLYVLTDEGYAHWGKLGVSEKNLKGKVNAFSVSQQPGMTGFQYFFVEEFNSSK